MRILLYTGKGGVGKTTVAAATALHLADTGYRTLVLSTDPAHSLGDALSQPLTNEPTEVAPGLRAAEIDTLAENDLAWERLRAYLARVLTTNRVKDLASEEMLTLPGLGELFALLRILDHARSGEYDVIVVDCAPTGETLSLLKYPERLGKLFATALPTKRALVKVLGRPFEKLTKVPMPEDRLFDDVMGLLDRLTQLGDLLHSEDATMRLVTTPERIVVAETRRAHTWLTMYGFVVDAVVCNRIYPDGALGGYFAPWAANQAAGVRIVEESFAHLPIHKLPLQSHEIEGLTGLRALAAAMYGDVDPAAVNYRDQVLKVTRDGDVMRLHIKLPEADKADLDLQQDGHDLLLAYRNEHRRIALPEVGKEVVGARYSDGELVVTLG